MDTRTSYLGFRLRHPFMAGASPLGWSLDTARALEDAGCAALVLPSLFEEQITRAVEGRIRHMDPFDRQWVEPLKHFPQPSDYPLAPDEYANHVRLVKAAVEVPVIGSLNGISFEAWLAFARTLEQAGADALELNLYEVVTDLGIPGTAIEYQLTHIVKELKQSLRIPLAIKLSPFFAAFGNVARQLDVASADGLVMFNRFYQPDIDVDTMEPTVKVELSTSAELRLRLRWLAILHGRIRASLAASGGIATPEDGIKAILAGADAVQMVSAVLRHGPQHFTTMQSGLERWMEQHGVESVDDVHGRASLKRVADPSAFERAQYIKTLQSWKA